MLKHRIGRIALVAFLTMGVLSIVTTGSYAVNGAAPWRVIKDFVAVSFERNVWDVKSPKNGSVEHHCKPNVGPYCFFAVHHGLFFDNCTTAVDASGEGGLCGVGVAEPLGGINLPEGSQVFACEGKSIVRTTSNMLFVPETCHDDEL